VVARKQREGPSTLKSPLSMDEWNLTHQLNVAWHAYYIEDFKWRLHFQFRVAFEGLFWEMYILKGKITFEGHWRLQSGTLPEKEHSWVEDARKLSTLLAMTWDGTFCFSSD
jgi:hypothetical protein